MRTLTSRWKGFSLFALLLVASACSADDGPQRTEADARLKLLQREPVYTQKYADTKRLSGGVSRGAPYEAAQQHPIEARRELSYTGDEVELAREILARLQTSGWVVRVSCRLPTILITGIKAIDNWEAYFEGHLEAPPFKRGKIATLTLSAPFPGEEPAPSASIPKAGTTCLDALGR